MEDFDRPERTWKELIQIVLENSENLPRDADRDLRWAEQHSQAMRFRCRFLELARDASEAEGQLPSHPKADALVDQAVDVANGMLYAYSGLSARGAEKEHLTASDVRKALSMTYHADPRNLIYSIKEDGRLAIDRDSFEIGVMGYLESQFRDRDIGGARQQARGRLVGLYAAGAALYRHARLRRLSGGRTGALYRLDAVLRRLGTTAR